MKPITFGEIREYCSIVDRVSICFQETLEYQNYNCIKDVPAELNDKYLYGFGRIESEFYGSDEKMAILPCIEIMVSDKPCRESSEDEK